MRLRSFRMSPLVLGGLLVAGFTGMGGLLILWWAAFINGFIGNRPWAVVLILNRFGEQWVEGIIFHMLELAVILALVQLIRYSGHHQ